MSIFRCHHTHLRQEIHWIYIQMPHNSAKFRMHGLEQSTTPLLIYLTSLISLLIFWGLFWHCNSKYFIKQKRKVGCNTKQRLTKAVIFFRCLTFFLLTTMKIPKWLPTGAHQNHKWFKQNLGFKKIEKQ